jgi:hypothetical protein
VIVTVVEDVFDPSTWETVHDVENIHAFNQSRWPSRLPNTARFYHKHLAQSCDVTPHDELEIERLGLLDGHLYVVIYPEGFEIIAIIIAIVLAAVSIGLSFLLRPNSAKPDQSASPNNALADRQNTQRPNERIPDIVGCVRATPDLIQVPYRVFISNQEVEYDYMCVGRGSHTVTKVTELTGSVTGPVVYDIKEDTTFVEQIDGNSVEVYGPNTSPNSGDEPQLRIGSAILEPLHNISKSSSVIGQILRAPNDQLVNTNMRAHSDGTLEINDSNIDLTDYFAIGDNINLNYDVAHDSGSSATTNLVGNYVAIAVTTSIITFAAPSAVNAGWTALAAFTGAVSTYSEQTMIATGSRVVGPFILDVSDMTEVWANFVAPNGLFKVSSATGQQYQVTDVIALYVQALDEDYLPVGAMLTSECLVVGSGVLQSQRATTLKFPLPLRTDGKPAGRVQVSAVRISDFDPTWQGTNADQIQWRDLYAVTPVNQTDFGDVTTVQTRSYATASALTAASRKFNLEVTRNLPILDPVTHLPVPVFTMEVDIDSLVLDQGSDIHNTVTFTNAPTLPTGALTYTIEGMAPIVYSGSLAGPISGGITVTPNGTLLFTIAYSGDGTYPALSVSFELSVLAPGATFVVTPSSRSRSAPDTAPTRNAADIACFLALDPYCGNRTIPEIDFAQIQSVLGTTGEVATYFGTPACAEFCYTFDDGTTTFEEMIQDIGQATGCTPYRVGSLMRMFFEKLTDTSVILFNHRNMIPHTETRTVTFGLTNNYDSIEFDYIDPNAPNYPQIETTVTLYFPPDQSGVNPKKVKSVGVRNNVQAWMMGWRLFQKLVYQNTAVQFSSTAEADILINTQRMLVADGTRPDTQDGQLDAMTGFIIETSQPVVFDPTKTYVVFLQHYDGTVEAITATEVVGQSNQILLGSAPLLPLVLDDEMFAKTLYQLVADQDARGATPMMLAEKTARDGMVFDLNVVNYDTRYYFHDQDFITGAVTMNDGTSGGSSAGFPVPFGGGTGSHI